MNDQSRTAGAPRVLVSASLAYDYIMTFPGSFKEHILPEKAHVLSVSFLFDSLRRHRGGIAGNIAYNLALLGEPSAVVGAGGSDFGSYRVALDGLGIDTSLILDVPDLLTGSAFMTTDLDNNQIAGFFPGASVHAAEISIRTAMDGMRLGIVGATSLEAMRGHVSEIAASGVPLVYDPSQQVVALSAEDLVAGIDAAWAIVGSDYEFAMITQKTGLEIDDLAERAPLLIVTYGDQGSEFRLGSDHVKIPAVRTDAIVDPTGGGDAYRAGFIKGVLLGFDLPICGRLGALAATYAIERHGTQEHAYQSDEFVERFEHAFPDERGTLDPTLFRTPAPAGDLPQTIHA